MRRALILTMMVACTQSGDPPPASSRVESFEWPGMAPPQLDVLVVIDDTPEMAPYVERTAAMLRSFPAIWSDTGWTPRPDLHVAVTTADPADAGQLHAVAAVHGAFLVDETSNDYLSRAGNHDGGLDDALVALGAVGTSGGASAPLTAMEAAIEGAQGLLRPDADLSIIVVTAHDDASSLAVDDAIAWARQLKADPAAVVVSVVSPASTPRLDAFAAGFPNRSGHASIDASDYRDAVTILGQIETITLAALCLPPPIDVDPDTAGDQVDCQVDIELRDGTWRSVSQCPGDNCWAFHLEPACVDGPMGRIDIGRFHWPVSPHVRGQCVVGD